jgi:HEAT repeat protein
MEKEQEFKVEELIEQLHEGNNDIKRRALCYLELMRAPEAIAPTLALVNDKDPIIRSSALSNLAAYDKKLESFVSDIFPALIKATTDPEANVRETAAISLSYTFERAIPALIVLLDDISIDVRLGAIKALGTLDANQAVGKLISIYEGDEDVRLKKAVLEVLFKIPDERGKYLLIKTINDDSDLELRIKAIREACRIRRNKEVIYSLCVALNDENKEVRIEAIDALSLMRFPSDINFSDCISLIHQALNKYSDIKGEALELIEDIENSINIESCINDVADQEEVRQDPIEIIQKFQNDCAYEREQAIKEFIGLTDQRAYGLLIEALKDQDADVRAAAAQALPPFKNEASIQHLIPLLKDSKPYVRRRVLWALSFFEHPKITNILLESLKDIHPHVRKTAAKTLKVCMMPAIVDPLIQALADEDNDVRSLAANTLTLWVKQSPNNSEKYLIQQKLFDFLNNSEEDISFRRDITQYLGRILTPEATDKLIELSKHKMDILREAALEALTQSNCESSFECIMYALENDSTDIRRSLLNKIYLRPYLLHKINFDQLLEEEYNTNIREAIEDCIETKQNTNSNSDDLPDPWDNCVRSYKMGNIDYE